MEHMENVLCIGTAISRLGANVAAENNKQTLSFSNKLTRAS